MLAALLVLLRSLLLICRGHRAVALENIALRQQLATLTRVHKRRRVRTRDRLFWVCRVSAWRGWRTALVIVHPDTVVRWHRKWLRRQVDGAFSAASSRPPEYGCGHSNTRDEDCRREPALGSTSDPRRVGQTGRHGLGANRLQARAAATSSAVPDLAHLPDQSHRRARIDRFLHRSHTHGPRPVRRRRPVASSPADRSSQRHRASDGSLDGAEDDRRPSRRDSAPLAVARSRHRLWRDLPTADRRHGHRRGPIESIQSHGRTRLPRG